MMYRRYQPKGQPSQPVHNVQGTQNGTPAGAQMGNHQQGAAWPEVPRQNPSTAAQRQSANHQSPQRHQMPQNQHQQVNSSNHQQTQRPQPMQNHRQTTPNERQNPMHHQQNGGHTSGGWNQNGQNSQHQGAQYHQEPAHQHGGAPLHGNSPFQEEAPFQGNGPGQGNAHQGSGPHRGGGQKRNPLLNFIPSSLYNPETKKVLGFLSTEDLLLVALILLFLENDENEDPMIIYALLYVLVSDYIDLGGLLNF